MERPAKTAITVWKTRYPQNTRTRMVGIAEILHYSPVISGWGVRVTQTVSLMRGLVSEF